jgi:hypothetical protein
MNQLRRNNSASWAFPSVSFRSHVPRGITDLAEFGGPEEASDRSTPARSTVLRPVAAVFPAKNLVG